MEEQKTRSVDLKVGLEILKVDKEKRIATGWVAIVTDENGTPIIDADDHVIPIMELEKAVHKAFAESSGAGMGGDMHTKRGMFDIIESFVVTNEKRVALGLGEGPEGWIASIKVNDNDLWEKIKNGERPEFSMRGNGMGTWV